MFVKVGIRENDYIILRSRPTTFDSGTTTLILESMDDDRPLSTWTLRPVEGCVGPTDAGGRGIRDGTGPVINNLSLTPKDHL